MFITCIMIKVVNYVTLRGIGNFFRRPCLLHFLSTSTFSIQLCPKNVLINDL